MLNRTGEYALMATVYITQTEEEWPVSGPRIARHTGIPAKYLSMVLGTLVRAGILDATRGKKGGFRFKRDPRKVHLLDIVAPFDPRLTAADKPCPFGNLVCDDTHPCGGHKSYKRITDGLKTFLTKTSIAKVATAPGTARRSISGKKLEAKSAKATTRTKSAKATTRTKSAKATTRAKSAKRSSKKAKATGKAKRARTKR